MNYFWFTLSLAVCYSKYSGFTGAGVWLGGLIFISIFWLQDFIFGAHVGVKTLDSWLLGLEILFPPGSLHVICIHSCSFNLFCFEGPMEMPFFLESSIMHFKECWLYLPRISRFLVGEYYLLPRNRNLSSKSLIPNIIQAVLSIHRHIQ